jgi:hypothetical protein
MSSRISRTAYADMYGPTTGDRLRLADTDLVIEVERDLTTYGEEVKFGGGKSIRDGMGQSQATRAEGAADTVITNALILDWTGITKADVGLRGGRIAAIGKAGNPDTQPGVTIVIGPGTDRGEDALTEYLFNSRTIRHLFCRTCGIESFAYGRMPDGTPIAAINVNCLEDVDPMALPTSFFDGRSA